MTDLNLRFKVEEMASSASATVYHKTRKGKNQKFRKVGTNEPM